MTKQKANPVINLLKKTGQQTREEFGDIWPRISKRIGDLSKSFGGLFRDARSAEKKISSALAQVESGNINIVELENLLKAALGTVSHLSEILNQTQGELEEAGTDLTRIAATAEASMYDARNVETVARGGKVFRDTHLETIEAGLDSVGLDVWQEALERRSESRWLELLARVEAARRNREG